MTSVISSFGDVELTEIKITNKMTRLLIYLNCLSHNTAIFDNINQKLGLCIQNKAKSQIFKNCKSSVHMSNPLPWIPNP